MRHSKILILEPSFFLSSGLRMGLHDYFALCLSLVCRLIYLPSSITVQLSNSSEIFVVPSFFQRKFETAVENGQIQFRILRVHIVINGI